MTTQPPVWSTTDIDLKKQIQDDNLRWYGLSVNSNQEEIVVENIKERIKKVWLEEDIQDFFIPIINEIITRKGKKVIKPKKLYPWYMFIRMKMNEKIWYIVRNTPWVRLIIWADIRPIPIEENEFQRIVDDIKEKNKKITTKSSFKMDDIVMIKESTFKNMKWKVVEVDNIRWTLTIMIEFMWRTTPVTMPFEKVDLVV